MLVSRTEYAPGLGDFLSTQKARSQANKTSTPQVGIAQTLAPGFSGSLKTQAAANKVLSLVGSQTALANWNANQNINLGPAPVAATDAQIAAAKVAYAQQVQKTGTGAQKFLVNKTTAAAAPATRPGSFSLAPGSVTTGLLSLNKPGAFFSIPAPTAAAPVVVSPAVQTAAALVAAQPVAAPSTYSSGGGGGGGDSSSGTDPNAVDPNAVDPNAVAPTGWAALSPQMQMGVVVGGLVVVGGIVYLIRRKR